MLSRRRRLPRGDAGVTLAELLVASAISMIIATLAMQFFSGIQNFGSKSVLTNQTTADARVTLDTWTNTLRYADWLDLDSRTDRFEEITPTKIVFYANLGNRSPSDLQVGARTKVVLMLRVTNATTGDGQLVEIRFKADNVTAKSVRQLSFNATRTGGAAVFQPYNQVGGAVDVANTQGCKRSSTPQAGLCLQSLPTGAGMVDPDLASNSLSVAQPAQPLRGNSAVNVDATLQGVGGITINFTVRDAAHTTSTDFTSSASISSGFSS